MTTFKTLNHLVEEHTQRVYQLVQDTLNRLDLLKIKQAYILFDVQNSAQLTSDLERSGFNAVDEALQRNLIPDEAFVQALKDKVTEAKDVWNKEYNARYEVTPPF